jgi:hypothetical protein
MTASPKLDGLGSISNWSYSNDILGNRTNRNYTASDPSSRGYDWDVLNRMPNCYGVSTGASYNYRADDQRIEKSEVALLSWQEGSQEHRPVGAFLSTSR